MNGRLVVSLSTNCGEGFPKLDLRPALTRRSTPDRTRRWKDNLEIQPGATVTCAGQANAWGSTARITGQVWSRASRDGYWYVVDDHGHAWHSHKSSMHVLGQCGTLEGLPLALANGG